jgi:geranylgeranyl pyrophosphate synthase
LAIRTREKADASRLKAYDQAMTDPSLGNKEKVSRITTIMREVGADLDLLSLSSEFSDKATLLLDNLEVEQSQKEPLRKLAQLLLQRTT